MTEHGIHPGRKIAPSWQVNDLAFRTWSAARDIIRTRFEQGGSTATELAAATGMNRTNVHRLIKGQERYTLESFVRLCAALHLDAVQVFQQASVEAKMATSTTL